MKGKIAFVLGAAVGYVLGTRAGRERYEQIKRGAARLWRTEPVQRGVSVVKDVVDDRAGDLKTFAVRVGNDVFTSLAKNLAKDREPTPPPASTSDDGTGGAEAGSDRSGSENSGGEKSSDDTSSDEKSSGAKSDGSPKRTRASSSSRESKAKS